MKNTLQLFLIFVFCTNFSFAQKVKFEASIDRAVVAVGEEFTIVFSSNTDLPSFQSPSLEGFRIVSGPNYQNSVEIINGKTSVQTILSYTLTAIREGNLKIEPASITLKGKTYNTKPLAITVTASMIGSLSKESKKKIVAEGKSRS